jgi:hypothetical protein
VKREQLEFFGKAIEVFLFVFVDLGKDMRAVVESALDCNEMV